MLVAIASVSLCFAAVVVTVVVVVMVVIESCAGL
jgi:hypothetical protein